MLGKLKVDSIRINFVHRNLQDFKWLKLAYKQISGKFYAKCMHPMKCILKYRCEMVVTLSRPQCVKTWPAQWVKSLLSTSESMSELLIDIKNSSLWPRQTYNCTVFHPDYMAFFVIYRGYENILHIVRCVWNGIKPFLSYVLNTWNRIFFLFTKMKVLSDFMIWNCLCSYILYLLCILLFLLSVASSDHDLFFCCICTPTWNKSYLILSNHADLNLLTRLRTDTIK